MSSPIKKYFVCFMLVFISVPLSAQPSASLTLSGGRTLTLSTNNSGLQAKIAESVQPTNGRSGNVETALRTATTRAMSILAIGTKSLQIAGKEYFVLAVARSSVARPGGGYCGAGTEDSLLLIQFNSATESLMLRDTMLIQSCLQSLSLASDQGNELNIVLKDARDPGRIELTWLDHPQYGNQSKTVQIRNGRFSVE